MSTAIRARVAELAALDPKRRVFGAGGHGYRFNAALTSAELTTFERKYRCTLPEDYRAFLLHVGNGGAGPFYGLFPLEGGDEEDITAYERLGSPFPHTGPYNPEHLLDEEGDDDDAATPYELAFSDLPGALYLCAQGCALRSFLVVTGPCRGEVWSDLASDGEGLVPELQKSGGRHTFTSWYDAWLDEQLANLRRR